MMDRVADEGHAAAGISRSDAGGRRTGRTAADVDDRRSSVDADLLRPAPAEPIVDRLRAWAAWFGVARIVVSAISMVIVCTGAFWLVRSPPPSAEAVLPQATAVVVPVSTLPPPVAAPGSASAAAGGGDGVESGPPVSDVTVHVAGAVIAPGVYVLGSGARVGDAVAAAGGPTPEAEVDALNLAAVLADGTRVYVPEPGEVVVEAVVATPVPSGSGGAAGGESGSATGPIDINRADVGQLDALPGVGPATAAAIVAERERNGPFLGVDDLERVPGIGPAKLAGLRDLVVA